MKIRNLLISSLYVCLVCICISNVRGQPHSTQLQGGYLFIHMRHEDYGRMYYYISRDARTWTKLNNNQRGNAEYRGYPDIIKGHDNRYYMIGVSEKTQKPLLWTSSDLVAWSIEKELPVSPFVLTDNYYTERNWFGAPKLYYDEDSKQYIVTWHAAKKGVKGNDEWKSMRTYYVLTEDFSSFSSPKRLFDFPSKADSEMATIDVIIRKIGKNYYAVIKDERWPEDGISDGEIYSVG